MRLLAESDLSQLALIEERTQAFPWTEDTFKQCFNSGYRGWVLEQDNKVIGFIIVTLQMDECHILNIAIHPDYQRRGLGYQLLADVLALLKEKAVRAVYLEVRSSNLPAISLYHKLGFVEVTVRKNYYPSKKGREDAIVLAKDLRVE